jgi:23S rRNA (adenine2030-N6)-methyltransferase
MNYRHAFHAGNFADVFKHVLLTRALVYLLRKPAPIRYLDTHAGRGLYDLAGPEAERTGEWRDGIGRLEAAPPEAVAALVAPYLDLARPGHGGGATSYPGSPVIAQRLLRPGDRLTLCERQPEEALALTRALGRDPRANVVAIDGYVALAAFVPPKERRGLVLIDPPYEAADEVDRLEHAVRTALRKWPTGAYAVWYPVKDPAAADAFVRRFAHGSIGRLLRLELLVEAGPKQGRHDAPALVGCGLLAINPPFALADEAALILPWLAERLRRGAGGGWRREWLAGG